MSKTYPRDMCQDEINLIEDMVERQIEQMSTRELIALYVQNWDQDSWKYALEDAKKLISLKTRKSLTEMWGIFFCFVNFLLRTLWDN
jgi:hypothetical protein